MARPKKAAAEQRNKVAKCMLTPEEDLTLTMNAAAAGVSRSEFQRRRLLGLTITPPPTRADATLLMDINRIGVNVNQLAFAANADREFKGDWQAIYEELARVLEKVALRYGS